MIIEVEINGARLIISGDNLSVSVSDGEAQGHVPAPRKAISKLTEWIKAERGRLSRLAEFMDITPGAVAQWNEVPAERMGDIASFTGIPMQELRPDIFAKADRPTALAPVRAA